jgi:sulfite exporter TauE/SafE
MKRPRWSKGDLPAALGLTLGLWPCALILIAVFVAPLFGSAVGWAVAITAFVVLVPICIRITATRTFGP